MRRNYFLYFFLLIALISAQPITSALTLIQYEPTVFQLKFSQPVNKPAFQLLRNNLYPLNYSFLTKEQSADTFLIQAEPLNISASQNLESYQLIFNTPLGVGSGRLGLKSYILTANKVTVQIYFSQTVAIFAVIATYIMINFTTLGVTLIQFLQVYCLMMFKNQIKTMLYHEISKDMLLLNPVQVDGTYDTPGALQTIVFLPFFLVFISGLVGFTVKKLVNRPKSISMQIFYDGVVYNQFVIIGTVFCVPLFYNGTQFFTLIRNNIIDGGSSFGVMGSIISYMGVIASIFLIYLFIYILNPKMGETQVSWKKYLTSQQFKMFARLHEVAILQKWYRRNKIVIIILKRLLIALLFYWDNGFEISIFLLEFTNIFYIFTIRPFKIEAYMNIAVIVRLLMFIFYGLVILGNLYYSLGSITFNYESTKTFLTIRDILFLVFFLIIFLLNFYEVYIKCSNLNYQFRLVREENEYKFKIIERQRHDTQDIRQYRKSLAESEDRYAYQNHINRFESPNKQIFRSPTKHRSGSTPRHTISKTRSSKKSQQKQQMKNSLGKQQIDITKQMRQRTNSILTSSSKSKGKLRRQKNKWRQQSLLAQILKQK